MQSIDTPTQFAGVKYRMATRAVFFLAGMGLAAWAPLVPFVKQRLAIDDATLGLLLLCLGLGSIVAMPLAGALSGRIGCRRVIVVASIVVLLMLPFLAWTDSIVFLALCLVLFGAGVGSVDVAMNVQAATLETASGRNLMSGFHGMFTLGSIVGAGGTALALGMGVTSIAATMLVSLGLLTLLAYAYRYLIAVGSDMPGDTAWFVLPKGRVILLGALCFVVFLSEGVVLDWGAIFLISGHGFDPRLAGLGYAAFAAAMTIGRFAGDTIVGRLGGSVTVAAGSILAMAGFVLAVFAPSPALILMGFAAVGLGAANIVPVFLSAAGRQADMSPGAAISAAVTCGYAGILVGPALVGFAAQQFGLAAAILAVGGLMAIVAYVGAKYNNG